MNVPLLHHPVLGTKSGRSLLDLPAAVPPNIKGYSPRSTRDIGSATRGGGQKSSRRRFELEFQTLYGIRLMQRQAQVYVVLDRTFYVLSVGVVAAVFGALAINSIVAAIGGAGILLTVLVGTRLFQPSSRRVACKALANDLARIRARSLQLDDTSFDAELVALQRRATVMPWSWICRPTFRRVCDELGCRPVSPGRRTIVPAQMILGGSEPTLQGGNSEGAGLVDAPTSCRPAAREQVAR